jgi:formylglycine-generating enzyme required for sulfatase activity
VTHSYHFSVSRRVLATGLCALLVSACVAARRPQVVVVIDTDLPLLGDLRSNPDLSADVAVDAVAVDVLGDGDAVTESRLFIAPDARDWPLSFGVAANGKSSARLRVAVFRASRGVPGSLSSGAPLEPRPALSVVRVFDVPLPREGVTRFPIVLWGACLGLPETADCGPSTAPSTGSTKIPIWSGARAVPCAAAAPNGSVCIAGGIAVLGEDGLSGSIDGILLALDPAPARLVREPPFFLDATEYTLDRLRAVIATRRSEITEPLPVAPSPDQAYCTFTDAADGRLPVNCLTYASARQLCNLDGGDLPTEAQWEFAARGRGQGRAFPWGDESPTCCASSVGGNGCAHGPAKVRSHVGDGCALADVSRDGVYDLAGNVSEITRDAAISYRESIWATPGVLVDPVATDDASSLRTARGGSWAQAPYLARASIRRTFPLALFSYTVGFRCEYPAGAR